MRLFAGIDGGQSSTVAVIGEPGRILARGRAGPADEVGQGPESTRLRDALRDALADALARAALPADTRFTCIVAGISGYEGRVYGRDPQLPADCVRLVHDTEIAHAGALGGEAGVVVIAGTGSVAYARNANGESALAGGWGYLFGDEGSAFWMARTVLADAMRRSDAGHKSDLEAVLLRHFAQPSLRALSRAFYAGAISRTQLAASVPVILEHRADLAADAARELVLLARNAAERAGLEWPAVAFTGGLLQAASLNAGIDRLMPELLPYAVRVNPRCDAAEGALLLAYRSA